MRICLVYDCLYPYTVGGAERWYRDLSLRLAEEGHEVTYLTLRQWERDERPAGPVRVIAVGPRLALYAGGRRRIGPPLIFGGGVLAHLLRQGRRYDVVHTASFPYFSLLGAFLARRFGGFKLVVDWFEIWTREYWDEYLGASRGRAGWWVQNLCVKIPQQAFCFSRLYERRLRALGVRGDIVLLEGLMDGPASATLSAHAKPVVVFAGRHIPEKRPVAVVPAVAIARSSISNLRGVIFGDGPERPAVLRMIELLHLEGIVEAPGFVDEDRIETALAHAMCLVLPSRREGYGLVLLEAMSHGTPVVVVAGPDNAAVELVEEGRNGFVASSPSPEDIAELIVRIHAEGQRLRETTANWFSENAARLSLGRSLAIVTRSYESRSARS